MLPTQAVGIDLGTTYSCIAHLNEKGEPVTLPNEDGELCTPSVVEIDRPARNDDLSIPDVDRVLPGAVSDEVQHFIVGTAALKNSILNPGRVIQNAKRYMGDPGHRWFVNGKSYSPIEISSCILRKLLSGAHRQIGPIEQAVITVPAQFSDAQRHATIEAGYRAGLERVDVINEPVAAALCHVLGAEGLWFSELAGEQRILVYDLGGGTFDLSIVRYRRDEVSVVATSGDLNLGGLNWNAMLLETICNQFERTFKTNPREDPKSLQALALEVEQTKRALSVRPRAPLTCVHKGKKKTYQIDIEQFEKLTKPLVDRTEEITLELLRENNMGWAHIDVVLVTGGASRMPMIRRRLKELSGRTLNTTLSPDLSIAHGATYYAGMLLTNNKFAKSILTPEASNRLSRVKQQSVNARALGILVRDPKAAVRVPHYIIAPNSPLPVEATEVYGTVKANQRRVNLQIVESGTSPDQPWVRLGNCVIDGLPPDLPEGSRINVTISYDTQAKVHVSARDMASGKEASVEILRQQNLLPQLSAEAHGDSYHDESDIDLVPLSESSQAVRYLATKPSDKPPAIVTPISPPENKQKPVKAATAKPRPTKAAGAPSAAPARRSAKQVSAQINAVDSAKTADFPVAICGHCKEPLDDRGRCRKCPPSAAPLPKRNAKPAQSATATRAANPKPSRSIPPQQPAPKAPPKSVDENEEEFWKYVE
ncbi:MAG: Hsp70 family protein [Planctomycetaceae bacterium]